MHGDVDGLERYADFSSTLGVNVWRTFAMWVLTGFQAAREPGVFDALFEFHGWLERRGLYLHLTTFCDQVEGSGSRVLLSRDEQDAFLAGVLDVQRRVPNAFHEVSNEDWQNGRVASRFAPGLFAGVLACRSAFQDGSSPDEPGSILDWTTEHTPRDAEWERKAKNLLETSRLGVGTFPPTRRPPVSGEPRRIAEGSTARAWADYAALCDLFGAGMTIHGGGPWNPSHESHLQTCEVPAGVALEHCQVIADVWAHSGIPREVASSWRYTAGHLSDSPVVDDGALKSYSMIAPGDMRAICVRVRETARARTRENWRVVGASGPFGQILHLER